MLKIKENNLFVFSISAIIVLIDQASKLWIKGFSIPFLDFHHSGMYYGERINLIGSLVRLTFVENAGMAFGIGLTGYLKFILSFFSIFASVGIIYYLWRVKNIKFVVRLALAVILGGAMGNLIDRVFYGAIYGYAPLFFGRVVDFIDIDFFHVSLFGYSFNRWPIFNVADMAVSTGVILLLFLTNKSIKEEPAEENNAGETLTRQDTADKQESHNSKGENI